MTENPQHLKTNTCHLKIPVLCIYSYVLTWMKTSWASLNLKSCISKLTHCTTEVFFSAIYWTILMILVSLERELKYLKIRWQFFIECQVFLAWEKNYCDLKFGFFSMKPRLKIGIFLSNHPSILTSSKENPRKIIKIGLPQSKPPFLKFSLKRKKTYDFKFTETYTHNSFEGTL